MSQRIVTEYVPGEMSEDAEFAVKESRRYLQFFMEKTVQLLNEVETLKGVVKTLQGTCNDDRDAVRSLAKHLDDANGTLGTDNLATVETILN
jgi:hypothetical protein